MPFWRVEALLWWFASSLLDRYSCVPGFGAGDLYGDFLGVWEAFEVELPASVELGIAEDDGEAGVFVGYVEAGGCHVEAHEVEGVLGCGAFGAGFAPKSDEAGDGFVVAFSFDVLPVCAVLEEVCEAEVLIGVVVGTGSECGPRLGLGEQAGLLLGWERVVFEAPDASGQ